MISFGNLNETLTTAKIETKTVEATCAAALRASCRFPRFLVCFCFKKHLCKITKTDRDWLRKIRPWWGHDRHFHVRLHCQGQSPDCRNQGDLSKVSPCGGEDWFSDAQVIARQKAAAKAGKKPKKKKKKTLPKRCRQLVSETP